MLFVATLDVAFTHWRRFLTVCPGIRHLTSNT